MKIGFNLGEALGIPSYLRELGGVGVLISTLYSNALVIAGIIFVGLLIFAGWGILTAQGDAQKFQQSQNIITFALVGFILIIAAYLIVRLIEKSLSLNIL